MKPMSAMVWLAMRVPRMWVNPQCKALGRVCPRLPFN